MIYYPLEISFFIFSKIQKRKDFAKWSDVKEKIFFFFDSLFASDDNIELPKTLEMEEAKKIIDIVESRKYNFLYAYCNVILNKLEQELGLYV